MGIQINGATDSITAIDGTIDVVSAIGNAGVVTATAFVGNITGNVTGNINHTSNLELQVGGVTRAHFNSSGHFGIAGITTFSDNVSIAGVTTASDNISIVKSSGPILELTTNTNAADATLRLSEGTPGSTTNGGGMFYSGADNKLHITCGTDSTTKRITILRDDGKVGINETSPDRDLHISNTTPYIRVESTSANQPATLELYHTRGNGSDKWPASVSTDDAALTFNVASAANGSPAERLRIRSDGYIGINTNSPSKLVTIKADAPFLRLEAADTSDKRLDLQVSTSGIATISAEQSSQQLSFRTTGGEALRITSDGNVLIGTQTNAGKLTVDTGGNTTAGYICITSAGGGRLRLGYAFTGGPSNDQFAEILTDTNGDLDIATRGNNSSQIKLFTSTGSGSEERLRITAGGNVNIGNSLTQTSRLFTVENTLASGGEIAYIGNNDGATNYGGLIISAGETDRECRLESAWGNSFMTFYTVQDGVGSTEKLRITSGGVMETGLKEITGGNNLAIQSFAVKGKWTGAPSIGKSIELISGYDSAVKMTAIGYNLTDTNTGSTYGGDLTFHTQPLYSSPTTPLPVRMRISSSGHVTKPASCAFNVTHNGHQNYSSAGTHTITSWKTTDSDRGFENTTTGGYFSSGIFTAPVAGAYFFTSTLLLKDTNGTNDVHVYWAKNDSTYSYWETRFNGTPTGYGNYEPVSGQCTMYMGVGDTCRIKITFTGTGCGIWGSDQNWGNWGGFLIG